MRVLVSAVVAIVVCGLSASSNAQTKLRSELDKIRIDYRDGRPFQYQPSDPFVRSKLFKTHIGHGGWFYNCDNQEAKRNSPYICWKVHHECDLPPKMRCIDRINCELAEIKQRIYDGAGACCKSNCDECACSECQGDVLIANKSNKPSSPAAPMRVASQNRRNVGKPATAARRTQLAQRTKVQTKVQPRAVTQRSNDEQGFGLVKGKIIPETSVSTPRVATTNTVPVKAPVQRVAAQPAAKRSLLENLAALKREGTQASVEVAAPQKIRTAKASIMNAFRPSKN